MEKNRKQNDDDKQELTLKVMIVRSAGGGHQHLVIPFKLHFDNEIDISEISKTPAELHDRSKAPTN
jgi:hypothetical protein